VSTEYERAIDDASKILRDYLNMIGVMRTEPTTKGVRTVLNRILELGDKR